MAELQRSRLLTAAATVVYELGLDEASVARITERAGISRRTFYELFDNRGECLLAAFDRGVCEIAASIAAAKLMGLPWRERMRGGLWATLCFLDREPALARLCVVDSLRADEALLEHRGEALARLTAAVDEGRATGMVGGNCTPLVAEGVVGGVLGVLHARLAAVRTEPLRALFPELMALIVQPYLGVTVARRERVRAMPTLLAAESPEQSPPGAGGLRGIPMRLTYRTARVLKGIAEHPGVSNRRAADHAGVADQGQISKLLSRLERLGLVANAGERPRGEANAWTLTEAGMQVARNVGVDTSREGEGIA